MEVIKLVRTREFAEWLLALRDKRAKARIVERTARLADGNPGHSRSVGSGVVELKIDYGPGYRVYYVRRGPRLIFLLCGGDKSTQDRDIRRAVKIADELPKE